MQKITTIKETSSANNVPTAWGMAVEHATGQSNSNVAQTFSNHATMVAGVMVAARNGEGGVGVAYNASLAGQYIQGTGLEVSQISSEITAALAKFKNYDVVNNSWGPTANFQLNVVPVGTVETWGETDTAWNEQVKTASSGVLNSVIPDGASVLSRTLTNCANSLRSIAA